MTQDIESLHFLGFMAENFKKLKLVEIRAKAGITKLIGPNGAGKSSNIDAIWWAIGGQAGAVKNPVRRGEKKAKVEVYLDELTICRTATAEGGETLVVKDRDGTKKSSAQTLLNGFLGKFFDPWEFVTMDAKEREAIIAKVSGIDLRKYVDDRKAAYEFRTAANRRRDEAKARLDALPMEDVPEKPVSVSALAEELTAAQDHNAGIDAAKRDVAAVGERLKKTTDGVSTKRAALERLRSEFALAEAKLIAEIIQWDEHAAKLKDEHALKAAAAEAMGPRDLAPIKAQIADSEKTNAAVQRMKERKERAAAFKDANKAAEDADAKVKRIDADHEEAVKAARLPIAGLAFTEAGVTFGGTVFDECSQAEQLRVGFALGVASQPKLKLFTIKQGSLIDAAGESQIARLAEEHDVVVFMERVDMGTGEAGVYISDGEVVEGGAH